ncbi:glutathione S-transferase family protein [Bradyrhizobium rifense]|uniref:Glutathione S-transferase family protein n=1 Tax=Bradyrhizobium rifense TaxID=515499 RepID=A0A5D3K8T3_9BRAD|nr:glutathione S-transferase family protein [Bradyrhizobium rifense]TYL89903.1 glutathione S-transferase family protein [Bradyrhizobium rifense]
MTGIVLYGFDGSTYVRTVRMLLAEKGARYEQVPVNVLKGEPRQSEHMARHPFGKVPVLDHDGFRIIETGAIAPYLDEVLPGPSFTPDSSKDRARMRMAMGIIDSYGYGALIAVAGYHFFPDLIGEPDEEARKHAIVSSRRVLQELMKIRGGSAFIAGEPPSLADFYVAPICCLVSLTPDANEVFAVEGFTRWWEQVQAMPSYQATAPRFGWDLLFAAAAAGRGVS